MDSVNQMPMQPQPKAWPMLLLGLVIGAALGAGGYYWYQQMQPQTVSTTTTSTTTTTPATTNTATTTNASGKTYSNSKYDYSFNYPEKYSVITAMADAPAAGNFEYVSLSADPKVTYIGQEGCTGAYALRWIVRDQADPAFTGETRSYNEIKADPDFVTEFTVDGRRVAHVVTKNASDAAFSTPNAQVDTFYVDVDGQVIYSATTCQNAIINGESGTPTELETIVRSLVFKS